LHLFNLSQFAATEERFAAVLRQNDAVAIDDVTRHLKEAMANGSIPDQDPAMLAHALVGATRHLARTYLYRGEAPVEVVADVAVRFVMGGLTAASKRN
jgi:AcrR family transcriptional regulator